MVGDLFCLCPLPDKVLCGASPFQPLRRTHRHGCMAGYHYLMPKGIIIVAIVPHNPLPNDISYIKMQR